MEIANTQSILSDGGATHWSLLNRNHGQTNVTCEQKTFLQQLFFTQSSQTKFGVILDWIWRVLLIFTLVSSGQLVKEAITNESKVGEAIKPYVERNMLGEY